MLEGQRTFAEYLDRWGYDYVDLAELILEAASDVGVDELFENVHYSAAGTDAIFGFLSARDFVEFPDGTR